MNFKITHNMLLDYLETDATPMEIQEYVSLCGPNVETVTKVGDDYVYDIEVTSNRIDAASAFGFALECAAILPRYNKNAHIKTNPLEEWVFASIATDDIEHVDIQLESAELASRVTAIVLKDVTVGPSPAFIKERLEACGISVINNIVDISNYIMISLGQPNHTFDFDKINGGKMLIRKSRKGEKIKTLDAKEFVLPGDDIVIEDGSGELIDLAGIMGGFNSSITTETKNVLLFMETYNKSILRRTSMTTGQRSMAVSYFEKGLDEERIESALVFGVKLLTQHSGGKPASKIYDIYPERNTGATVKVGLPYIRTITNTELIASEIRDLIKPLGFTVVEGPDEVTVQVPSYRSKDVNSPADIVEEIARIYGYHNIPGMLQIGETIDQPLDIQGLFNTQTAVRDYLRAIGFNEQLNYSMVSKKLIGTFKISIDDHLHISNTISEEIEYMRTSLIPSLVSNIATNKGYQETFNFFECARTYVKTEGDLPLEEEKLSLVSTDGYSYLKGVLENLFTLLKIKNVNFQPDTQQAFLINTASTNISVNGEAIGYIGLLQKNISTSMDVDSSVVCAEISLAKLIQYAEKYNKYEEDTKFARIKRDYTYTSSPQRLYATVSVKAHKASPSLLSLSLESTYKNNVTIRMEFGHQDKNMTEEEAEVEFNNVKASLSE